MKTLIKGICATLVRLMTARQRKAEQARRNAAILRRIEQLTNEDCPVCGWEVPIAEEDDLGEIVTCAACERSLLVTCEAYECLTPEGRPVRIKLMALPDKENADG